MKTDVYQFITDTIIEAIEKDIGNPTMPWHRGSANGIPVNILTNNEYHGINILNLWLTSLAKHYSSNVWGTFRQWRDSDAQVRKGEKASPIIFYKQLAVEEEGKEKQIRVLRYFFGFNADQVDGYENPDCSRPIANIEC